MRASSSVSVLLFVVAVSACEHGPGAAREALARGTGLAAAGRTDDAQAAYEEAARLDPKLWEARMHLARLALDRGQFERAKSLAAGVLHDVPHAPYPLELLGRAELGLGHDEAALSALSDSLARDPSRARLGYDIGWLDERLGRREAAIASYRAHAHADAYVAETRVALARLLLPGRQRREARAALDEAMVLTSPGTPLRAQVDGLLAWCDRLDHVAPPTASAGLAVAARDVRIGDGSGAQANGDLPSTPSAPPPGTPMPNAMRGLGPAIGRPAVMQNLRPPPAGLANGLGVAHTAP